MNNMDDLFRAVAAPLPLPLHGSGLPDVLEQFRHLTFDVATTRSLIEHCAAHSAQYPYVQPHPLSVYDSHPSVSPAPLSEPLFTSEALDLLLSSPHPWAPLAARFPLSDTQFARLIPALAHHTARVAFLDPHVTSPERLALLCATPLTNFNDLKSLDFLRYVGRLDYAEPALFSVVPHLTENNLLSVLLLHPLVHDPMHVTRPLSVRLITAVHTCLANRNALVTDHVSQTVSVVRGLSDLLSPSRPPAPLWYAARLLLRFPGALEYALTHGPEDYLAPARSSSTLPVEVVDNSVVVVARHVLSHLTPHSGAVVSLLDGPTGSLAEALSAATLLSEAP